MSAIRVLIIDDHTLFRSGINLLLQRQEGFEVVGEAGDGLEGVKRAKQLQPDVVLLDLHMPGTSGLVTIPLLREEAPQTQIIMLTVSEDAEDLLEALRAGARGYLLKNIETDFLVDSIRRAANGESVMSSQMAGKLADAMRLGQKGTGQSEATPDKLTPVSYTHLDVYKRQWYTFVDNEDLDEIIESHLQNGKVVERLLV